MSFLTNKHVVVALLVTPLLAIGGYFAVDALVREKPHAALEGGQYALVEKSNCRYNSGICDLTNGDFKIRLSSEWRDDNRLQLVLKSAHELEGALVALAKPEADDEPPVAMAASDETATRWTLEMARPDPQTNRLRIAVSSGKTVYYGDVAMKFTLYKTPFGNDFRRENE